VIRAAPDQDKIALDGEHPRSPTSHVAPRCLVRASTGHGGAPRDRPIAKDRESEMTKPFRGVVNVDVSDSVPGWGPYTQPIAPEGTPSVLYIVLDDVGYSAMAPF
jgi:hypothetical protein